MWNPVMWCGGAMQRGEREGLLPARRCPGGEGGTGPARTGGGMIHGPPFCPEQAPRAMSSGLSAALLPAERSIPARPLVSTPRGPQPFIIDPPTDPARRGLPCVPVRATSKQELHHDRLLLHASPARRRRPAVRLLQPAGTRRAIRHLEAALLHEDPAGEPVAARGRGND